MVSLSCNLGRNQYQNVCEWCVGADLSQCGGTFPTILNDVEIGGGLSNDTEYFNGDITGVRIWNTVRTVTEISDNMFQCIGGDESGLVAMYNMVDGTGSSMLTDESVNGYNGALMNMDPATSGIIQICRQ